MRRDGSLARKRWRVTLDPPGYRGSGGSQRVRRLKNRPTSGDVEVVVAASALIIPTISGIPNHPAFSKSSVSPAPSTIAGRLESAGRGVDLFSLFGPHYTGDFGVLSSFTTFHDWHSL
ncbi:hypothetical protein B0H12DRAFT_1106743 [Mycena haematopus]|nr:hypothetical protein B0H12DRAFT_1106743 [Mycena haematopus]